MGEIDEAQMRVAASVDEIRLALARAGLQYIDAGSVFMGSGVAVAWGEAFFAVLSVANFVDQQFSITYGVLRDVNQTKTDVLEYCNRHNQNFAAYPVYLHDAENGWDVIQQNVLPLQVLRDAPDFVTGFYLGGYAGIIEDLRTNAAEAGLGGVPYRWNEEDVSRLLLKVAHLGLIEHTRCDGVFIGTGSLTWDEVGFLNWVTSLVLSMTSRAETIAPQLIADSGGRPFADSDGMLLCMLG